MESGIPCAAPTHSVRKHAVPAHAKPAAPWRKKIGHQSDTFRIKIGVRFGASGDTAFFKKHSNINGFRTPEQRNYLYSALLKQSISAAIARFIFR